MRRLLVVEDDPRIGQELVELLKDEGYGVVLARSLAEARSKRRDAEFSLVLLDINLPDGLGYDLCREIRDGDAMLPVIFLTARLDEDSAVKGLSLGALDYIRKPFAPRELLARLRRTLKEQPEKWILNDLVVDSEQRQATWKTKEVSLTPREFDLLVLLIQNSGRLVSRESVMDRLDADGNVNDTAIKTYVSRLKAKLRDAGVRGIEITAVYGSGYRLEKT